MYTLEDITKIFETGDVKTDDGFNAVKTTLLTTLSDALAEYNEVSKDNEELKKENERLKSANTMLYSQIEKRFVDGNKITKEVIADENNEDDGEDVEKILKEQIETYGGLK